MPSLNFNANGSKNVVTAVINASDLSEPTKAYIKGLVASFPDEHQFALGCNTNDTPTSITFTVTLIAQPPVVMAPAAMAVPAVDQTGDLKVNKT